MPPPPNPPHTHHTNRIQDSLHGLNYSNIHMFLSYSPVAINNKYKRIWHTTISSLVTLDCCCKFVYSMWRSLQLKSTCLDIKIRWLDVRSSVRSCLLVDGNRSDLYWRKRQGFTGVWGWPSRIWFRRSGRPWWSRHLPQWLLVLLVTSSFGTTCRWWQHCGGLWGWRWRPCKILFDRNIMCRISTYVHNGLPLFRGGGRLHVITGVSSTTLHVHKIG